MSFKRGAMLSRCSVLSLHHQWRTRGSGPASIGSLTLPEGTSGRVRTTSSLFSPQPHSWSLTVGELNTAML